LSNDEKKKKIQKKKVVDHPLIFQTCDSSH
jgi:hypothetical protein